MCSDPDVKLANVGFFIALERQYQKLRYLRASNIFIYFSSIIDTKIGYLKLGVGLFNSSYKTMYLRKKSKLCFFY